MENFQKGFINFSKLLNKKQVESALASFSKKEWLVFYGLVLVLFVSTLAILQNINKSFMVNVPLGGGKITEGIVGTPRFINPVLAFSDVDRDLISLIYSGLMRKDTDGALIPDLAASYQVSPDGLVYTFTLKDKIYFHDGEPVKATDILFTINKIKDPIIKSPRKGNWDGVSVEIVDEKNIKFTLRQAYGSFLENTTLGIMPSHLWSDSPIELSERNTNPVGSGPYLISSANKQSSGVIDSYELKAFKDFALGKPYIKNLVLNFFPNEEDMILALENDTVEQISSLTPENALSLKEKGYTIESSVLPRIFGLFFNQNQNQIFTDKNVVQAINLAIDKDRIVREVLKGYGVVIDNPIPKNVIEYEKITDESKTSYQDKLTKARELLTKDGWKLNEEGFLEKTKTSKDKKSTEYIEFSISTGNAIELAETANLIKKDLEAIGMKVDVKTFEIGNLNQSVIRPRKYDALLFGQIINNESDLYAFWHSSQRLDPGLNVAMYTNAKVDKILEEAFSETDPLARIKKYSEFEEEIRKDMAAIFLYSPSFIYVVSKDLKGLSLNNITSLSDRFLGIYKWYRETSNVWKIFTQ
ncbi:ABC transporter substrate-binding protein [Candidatus Nomurabacteria bacterium]|nr:ABC transporter substrate-binding protein [Candidatus Nomurabacteria bacterium]